jgi:dTDP-4-dehydrorhamnose reductase
VAPAGFPLLVSREPWILTSVTQRNLLSFLADISPDVIIHTAAEGSVDAVQGNTADFQDINVNVGDDLARWCREVGAHLTFVSSNAVFGGSSTAYSDYSPLQPVNDYGRLKAMAETTGPLDPAKCLRSPPHPLVWMTASWKPQ